LVRAKRDLLYVCLSDISFFTETVHALFNNDFVVSLNFYVLFFFVLELCFSTRYPF